MAVIDIRPLEHAELQARLDSVICNLIRMHVGKPCPTRREIMWVSMLPRRQVWVYLGEMQERGLIEIEVQEAHPCGKDPKRRRMRVARGKWTDWTARRPAMVTA